MPGPDRRRAILLAGVWALLWVLGTPGLDAIPEEALTRPADRAQLEARLPAALWPVADALVTFNGRVRKPLVDALVPLQQPFRIRQEWSLYLDGPRQCHRLEVDVDGALRYRTRDPAHAWRVDLFRAPPIRPIVDGTAGKATGGGNWRGLVRLVTEAALAEDPQVQRVELRGMWGAFPACVTRLHHAFVAAAPDWEPREKS